MLYFVVHTDGCCDKANRLCVYGITVHEDFMKQVLFEHGNVILNPPYLDALPFVCHAEAHFLTCKSFQVALILPDWTSYPFHRHIVDDEDNRKIWRVMAYYPTGCEVFTRPHKLYPDNFASRELLACNWPVIVFICNTREVFPDADSYDIKEELAKMRYLHRCRPAYYAPGYVN